MIDKIHGGFTPRRRGHGVRKAVQLELLNLAISGASYQDMADEMTRRGRKMTRERAFQLLDETLNRVDAEIKAQAEKFRGLELERLNRVWMKAYAAFTRLQPGRDITDATGQVTQQGTYNADELLKIGSLLTRLMARRAKLLRLDPLEPIQPQPLVAVQNNYFDLDLRQMTADELRFLERIMDRQADAQASIPATAGSTDDEEEAHG